MRLTKRLIDAAKYEGGTDYRWDTTLPNFGIRVFPSGRKSFVVSYRVNGRKRIMSIGRYGTLTLDQARKKARRVMVDAADGKDVSSERSQRRQAPTMADLKVRYMREHAEIRKKPKSVEEDARNWKRHILPTLGSRKVADVTAADVRALHTKMAKTPIAANRVLALLSKSFNLAEVWGMRGQNSNPCQHVERYRESKKERFLSPSEIERLGEVLQEAEDTTSESPVSIAALRLLLLTGCRKGEILSLKWKYVDFERGCLRLPDSKTGAKVVLLGMPVLDLLRQLPREQGNPYVLPGKDGEGHLVGLHRPWARLRAKAGLEDVRLHDLRHSFASVGASGGMGLPMLGALLGHKHPATTARYSHLQVDPVQRAADQIAGAISSALGH